MESGYLSTVHNIYEPWDPVLKEWSARNKIPLQTRYREEEVRSFTLVGPDGSRVCQIWLELDPLQVKAWDLKERSQTFEAETSLESALDQALETARAWIDPQSTA